MPREAEKGRPSDITGNAPLYLTDEGIARGGSYTGWEYAAGWECGLKVSKPFSSKEKPDLFLRKALFSLESCQLSPEGIKLNMKFSE